MGLGWGCIESGIHHVLDALQPRVHSTNCCNSCPFLLHPCCPWPCLLTAKLTSSGSCVSLPQRARQDAARVELIQQAEDLPELLQRVALGEVLSEVDADWLNKCKAAAAQLAREALLPQSPVSSLD